MGMGKPTFRPADNEARQIARTLLKDAVYAALAVTRDASGVPFVSRIAVGHTAGVGMISLVSDLSQHTGALRAYPECSLLVGEPGDKGDPLTHPRLTLQCSATLIPRQAPGFADLRTGWLQSHPKSKLYIDFADFSFVRFHIRDAFLNGGFGFACMLTPQDLFPDLSPDLAIEPGNGQA